MRLLTKGLWILLTISIASVYCGQRGPLTPEDAFHALRRAYHHGDSRAVIRLLSRNSLSKVNNAADMFARMSDEQREIIAERLEMEPGRLKTLSAEEYMDMQFRLSRQFDEDVIHAATSLKIINIRLKDSLAVITVENGMELPFIKEGPYWKFDMSSL